MPTSLPLDFEPLPVKPGVLHRIHARIWTVGEEGRDVALRPLVILGNGWTALYLSFLVFRLAAPVALLIACALVACLILPPLMFFVLLCTQPKGMPLSVRQRQAFDQLAQGNPEWQPTIARWLQAGPLDNRHLAALNRAQ